jgi:hypothetical protein
MVAMSALRFILVPSLLLAGCATTSVTSDGRPMPPPPVAAPRAPETARANAMAVRVGAKATDTNGNGFPDEVIVEAFLYSEPHPMPIFQDGAFVFRLYLAGQGVDSARPPLVEWRIEGEKMMQSRIISEFINGPCHLFRLSLLETGGDEYPSLSTNLTCRFEPADGGDAVESSGVFQINVGRSTGRDS